MQTPLNQMPVSPVHNGASNSSETDMCFSGPIVIVKLGQMDPKQSLLHNLDVDTKGKVIWTSSYESLQ